MGLISDIPLGLLSYSLDGMFLPSTSLDTQYLFLIQS
jgi:hypothetical protein